MLFNSIQFLIFFPVVTAVYFWLPQRFRWVALLIASSYFYMAFIPVYILILIFTILIDYIAGICIEQAEGRRRKAFLVLSLIANIGVLMVFKYYNFFIDNVNFLLDITSQEQFSYWSLILPIGLSFHTFQAMSYTIEVYRRNYPAERHLGYYALYVMYYPQLVAGPIERPQNIIHQLKIKHRFNYAQAVDGIKLMTYGLFKKVVIADNLAAYVDSYYHQTADGTGYNSLIAIIFFSVQIYCDFSGYSDMAVGVSRVMGIDLMRNFNYPYFSHSVTEFWRKWHISLSTWFRDYLYIPLGGNKRNKYRNVMLVFMISGLWHGANWTFIIWGGIHGTFQLIEDRLGWKQNKGIWSLLYTNIIVALAWVFFRAPNIQTSLKVLSNLTVMRFDLANPLLPKKLFLITALFMIGEYFLSRRNFLDTVNTLAPIPRYSLYYALVLTILFMGRFGNSQFIYFQF